MLRTTVPGFAARAAAAERDDLTTDVLALLEVVACLTKGYGAVVAVQDRNQRYVRLVPVA
jgi:hypothetical protein